MGKKIQKIKKITKVVQIQKTIEKSPIKKEKSPRKKEKQSIQKQRKALPDAILFGTGEYTTGYVGGGGSKSDKGTGVVGLVHFDLRLRKKIGQKIVMCGTNGTKFKLIREHLKKNIDDRYKGISSDFNSFPANNVQSDPKAYLSALKTMQEGDIASVFTPDDCHYEITYETLKKGIHVMVTKPIVKTLKEHKALVKLAKEKNVLLQIEVHKRYDPIYNDARYRINNELGDFGYFYAYMSQPKFQLETFRAWAGVSSDISFYLNSHHVDFHVWAMQNKAIPLSVVAIASTGQGKQILTREVEDTITLTVQWRNIQSGNLGTAIYTSSWTDPKSDVHTQQHFYYQGHNGFIDTDQAHRGYRVSTDDLGLKNFNPLYMKYTPDALGRFSGQFGYGYKSFETFVDAVTEINKGTSQPADFDNQLPTGQSTLQVTAILEAGRISLDNKGKKVNIIYDLQGNPDSLKLAE